MSTITPLSDGHAPKVTPSKPAVRRVTKILVFFTFVLLVAGALVTGNKAALSDHTWPQFVGHWYPKYWVGGLVYEDSHRLTAGLVLILTIITLIYVQVYEQRKAMKNLAWGALGLVVVQALYGALIIHSKRHPAFSMIHGVLAQTFFCCTIAMALFSSKLWFHDKAKEPVHHAANQSFLKFMKFMILVVFFQVILGGGVRHSNDNGDMFFPFILAHIAGAFAVIIVVVWFALRVFHVYKDVKPLVTAVKICIAIILTQLVLGVLSIFANRARLEPGLAEFHHVLFSTLHLLVGATLLAVVLATYLRARNFLAVEDNTSRVSTETAYSSREANA